MIGDGVVIETICAWFCFTLALAMTLTLIVELFNDARNTTLLCSSQTNVGRITHPTVSLFRIYRIAFAWAAFGCLLTLGPVL